MKRESVLVTGTSSGLGLHTAVTLAKKGYKVYATMRNLDKKGALLEKCEKENTSLEVRALDITKFDTIEKVIAEIEEAHNGLDVLVNNAGFFIGGSFEDLKREDYVRQLETNFFGALDCTKAALPGMKKRQNGLIINVSSITGLLGCPNWSAYSASKFAMEGWSESSRYELKKHGICICLIEPGAFNTDISKKATYVDTKSDFSKGAPPSVFAKKVAKIIATRKPKIRYLVGSDAAAMYFLRWLLPISLYEMIMGKIFERYEH